MSSRGVRDAFGAVGRVRLRRNPLLPAIQFLLPLFFIVVTGIALGGYADPTFVIGVIDAAGTEPAAQVVESLAADSDLRVRVYTNDAKLRSAVLRGRVPAGVVLPASWQPGDTVEVYARQSEGTTAALALVEAHIAAVEAGTPTEVETEVAVAGTLSPLRLGFGYAAPAMVVQFAMITGLFLSSLLIELRERGFLLRMLATPTTVGDLFRAFGISPWLSTFGQAWFLILVTTFVFSVEWGQWLSVLLVTVALATVAMGLSFAFSTLFRSTRQAQTIGPLVGVVCGMLGGCFWPLAIVPPPLVVLGHLVPTAWAMDAFLALGFFDASWVEVLPEVAVLLSMAAGLLIFGGARLRATLSRRFADM